MKLTVTLLGFSTGVSLETTRFHAGVYLLNGQDDDRLGGDTPAVATSVERSTVVGFTAPINGWAFASNLYKYHTIKRDHHSMSHMEPSIADYMTTGVDY
jgi:hypothetical protein